MIALLFIVLLIFNIHKSFAGNNIIVDCFNEGPCELRDSTIPMFDEGGIAPGDIFTQTLTIYNHDTDDDCDISVHSSSYTLTGDLAEKIGIAIFDSSTIYYGATVDNHIDFSSLDFKNLLDFLSERDISLGSVSSQSSKTYTWLTQVDPTLSNLDAGQSTVFDFDIDFECNHTLAPTTGSAPSTGTTTLLSESSSQPPVCSAQKPEGNISLTGQVVGPGKVQLNWTSVYPVTHYMIYYKRLSDGAEYGAPNVGNVNSFVVDNLEVGQTYEFKVYGVNDCAVSDPSNSIFLYIQSSLYSLPVYNNTGVLGASTSTSANDLGNKTNEDSLKDLSESGTVKGESNTNCTKFDSYIPFILLLILLLSDISLEFLFKHKKDKFFYILKLIIFLLIVFIFFKVKRCYCIDNSLLLLLCKYFPFLSAIQTFFIRGIGVLFIESV